MRLEKSTLTSVSRVPLSGVMMVETVGSESSSATKGSSVVSVAGKKRAPAKPCASAGRGSAAAASKALPKTRARVDLETEKDFIAERVSFGDRARKGCGAKVPAGCGERGLPSVHTHGAGGTKRRLTRCASRRPHRAAPHSARPPTHLRPLAPTTPAASPDSSPPAGKRGSASRAPPPRPASFRALRPRLISWHSEQGCCPSKVFATATVSSQARELSTSIRLQASVWSTAQCPPHTLSRAMASIARPKR